MPSTRPPQDTSARQSVRRDRSRKKGSALRKAVAAREDGLAALKKGRPTAAIRHFQDAIEHLPGNAELHDNLGVAYLSADQHQSAERSARRALAIDPKYPEAYCNLGVALQLQQRLDEATQAYEKAIALRRGYRDARLNLARAHEDLGHLAAAAHQYQQILRHRPDDVGAARELGRLRVLQRRFYEAVALLEPAAQRAGSCVEIRNNLAVALRHLGRLDEARAHLQVALDLRPDFADAHANLGCLLKQRGQSAAAIEACRVALRNQPKLTAAANNLAGALKLQGRIDEAIAVYESARADAPRDAALHSNLLLAVQYQDDVTPQQLRQRHEGWAAMHAQRSPADRPFKNSRQPDRLRLGFVSPDLGQHPVGYFLAPVLEQIDAEHFVTVCYSDRAVSDSVSDQLRQRCTAWRQTGGLSDEQLEQQIVRDEIDVLFDLAGHTERNRLTLFARRAAPVQVSWAGYVGTTGLPQMDYLLADGFHVAEGEDEHYVEQVCRLPGDYICFPLPQDLPPLGPPPLDRRGQVTFGCFNNPAKITPATVALWSEILRQVPRSQLMLKYWGFGDPHAIRRYTSLFAEHGVEPGRLLFEGPTSHRELLQAYQQIDVALDPLPYSGGLTTCEALMMGVPVVTLPGKTFAGRHSTSHLHNAGLSDLVATDRDDYARRAVTLAGDEGRLRHLRRSMRDRLRESTLCDTTGFARRFEAAVRGMWGEWCDGR